MKLGHKLIAGGILGISISAGLFEGSFWVTLATATLLAGIAGIILGVNTLIEDDW